MDCIFAEAARALIATRKITTMTMAAGGKTMNGDIERGNESSGAVFSACGQYRYALWRRWMSHAHDAVLFIGLNPSTADESADDPTIRRCIGYAKSWGYGAMYMANLFAWRATDPSEMKSVPLPIGPNNDAHLHRLINHVCALSVAAWGSHGTHKGRAAQVMMIYSQRLRYLRLTKSGQPAHPLYLPKTLTPCPFFT